MHLSDDCFVSEDEKEVRLLDRDAITRDIYDYLKGKFSESDLRNPRMYDEILAEIKNSFGEAAMMSYINSGFYRPGS